MGMFDDLVPHNGVQAGPALQQPKQDKSALDWVGDTFGPNGNLRGSSIGGAMQGAADLGVGGVQLLANALGFGDSVNKKIAEKEQEYQAARTSAGRDGFDAARMAGNVAMTAPIGGGAGVVRGAMQGAALGALNPVTNGGDSFWSDKLKESGTGALGGAIAAPIAGAIGRVISPKASMNQDVKLLQSEGVKLTPGQAGGGWLNNLEEKLQSVPVIGDAITAARGRGNESFNIAALNRAVNPVGGVATESGSAGTLAARKFLGDKYDALLPNMAADLTDQGFVGKVAALRGGVQGLPAQEAKYFDDVISRELDGRIAPNGVLSAQNLKDAMSGISSEAKSLGSSSDAYQRKLGDALKQLHAELRTHVSASNPQYADELAAIDKGYANFKRVQRAGASVGAEGGESSPAQLYSAVKAMDQSKDKARFAEDGALLQDLAGAGKRVMGEKVRNSGSPERLLLGGGLGAMLTGSINPLIPMSVLAGSGAYIPQVQNAIVNSMTKRPEGAQAIANHLRSLSPFVGASVALNRGN